MATHFQNAPNQIGWAKIGESSSVKYTIVRGQPVYLGTDADSNTNRVIPVSDISAHGAMGLALTATADTAYTDDMCGVALWPVRIFTDNVDATNPPEAVANNYVYIDDDGEFTDADGGSALHRYGQCVQVVAAGEYSGLYELNLIGPVDDDTDT